MASSCLYYRGGRCLWCLVFLKCSAGVFYIGRLVFIPRRFCLRFASCQIMAGRLRLDCLHSLARLAIMRHFFLTHCFGHAIVNINETFPQSLGGPAPTVRPMSAYLTPSVAYSRRSAQKLR